MIHHYKTALYFGPMQLAARSFLFFVFAWVLSGFMTGQALSEGKKTVFSESVSQENYRRCNKNATSMRCRQDAQCTWRAYISKCTNQHKYHLSGYVSRALKFASKELVSEDPVSEDYRYCRRYDNAENCGEQNRCTWRAYMSRCTNRHRYHLAGYVDRLTKQSLKVVKYSLEDPVYDAYQKCSMLTDKTVCASTYRCSWRAYMSRCTNQHKYHLAGYATRLLKQEKAIIARYTLDDPVYEAYQHCKLLSDYNSCKKDEKCSWRAYMSRCTNQHKYHLAGYVKVAPKNFIKKSDIYRLYEKCRKKRSYQTCNRQYKWRLVRQIQKELTRLGCRPGPVDGLWGPLSRGALKRYNHKTESDFALHIQTEKMLAKIQKSKFRRCL